MTVLQAPQHPLDFIPKEVAQEYIIAINWNDFHDLVLPLEDGAITGVGIEWQHCTMPHDAIYGQASLLPGWSRTSRFSQAPRAPWRTISSS